MTPTEFRAAQKTLRRRAKYRAKPVLVESERLASKGEGAYYRELLWRVEAGEIRELSRQIRFELKMDGGSPVLLRSKRYPNGRKAVHVVDFSFIDNRTNQQVYQEFKGLDVPLGKLKRAMVEAQYGITIEVVGRQARGRKG